MEMCHTCQMDVDRQRQSLSKSSKFQKTGPFTKKAPVFNTPYKTPYQKKMESWNEKKVIELSDDDDEQVGQDELDEIYNNLIDCIDQIIDIKLRQYNRPFTPVKSDK